MGDFETSQKIQKMVFPNGVRWDKENRAYLTDFGNLFFDLMFSVSDNYKNEIAQKKDESCDLSSLVVYCKILSNNYLEALERVEEFRCFLERKPAR